MAMARRLRALLLAGAVAGAAAGCGSTARWHAGADRADDDARPATDPAKVELHYKTSFGAFESERDERQAVCATTTIVRTAFLVDPTAAERPDRDEEVLGWVTTEELPRHDGKSRILGDELTSVFGIGDDAQDRFEIALDPASRAAGEQRLKELAAALGADAVVDVFATGEAEYHMWHGTVISFETSSIHSPIYSGVKLLDFRLRDVRLHGTAVRKED
jgi:hypothetical protein